MLRKTLRMILLLALAILIVFTILELNSNTPSAVLNKLAKKGKLNAQNMNLRIT